jgi:hypothetical protein
MVISLAVVEFPTPRVKNDGASFVVTSARLIGAAVPAVLSVLY